MISENIDKINERMEKLESKIDITVNDVNKINVKMNEINNDVTHLLSNTNFVDNELEKLRKNIKDMKNELDTCHNICKTKCNELEDRSRRNNLRIDGIKESANETWDETEEKVKSMFSNKLNVKNVMIERAHRVGKSTEDRPTRTIVLKMLKYKEKELALSKAKKLKNTGIFINEDFCADTMMKRKALWDKVKEHRKNGKFATVRYDKLIVREFKNK